jgi:transcriptional regulator with XRE-family HTH domain
MRRKNLLFRLFRALSGMTQKGFAQVTGLHPVLVAKYEMNLAEPGAEHLERSARGAGLTMAAGEQLLDRADALRRQRRRAGQGSGDLAGEIEALVSDVYQRMLRAPLPEILPGPEDRAAAAVLWPVLEALQEEDQLTLVRIAPDYQVWPLAERAWEESALQASRDPDRAASLARLAREIADHVRA